MLQTLRKNWIWLLLILPDASILLLALWLSLFSRFGEVPSGERLWLHIQVFAPLFLVWLAIFYIHGLYEARTLRRYSDIIFGVLSTVAVSAVVAVVYFYLQPESSLTPRRVLLINLAYIYLLAVLWRLLVRKFLIKRFVQDVYVLGGVGELHALVGEINEHRYLGYQVAGHINEKDLATASIPEQALVVMPDSLTAAPEFLKSIYQLRTRGVLFYNHRDFYEMVFRRIWLAELSEIWFLENINYQKKQIYNIIKRLLDIVAGLVMGVVFVITLPIFTLLIRLSSPGPVIFMQKRVGQHGSIFTVYKFRTMFGGRTDTWTTPGDPRITWLGNIMRKMRLDELPQCINLLKGDMSLVGPRPEQVHFVEQLRIKVPFFEERHLVKPGLTGWAQLNVYAGSLEETKLKLQYDLYYIKHRSLLFDTEIVFKTLYYIFTLSGR